MLVALLALALATSACGDDEPQATFEVEGDQAIMVGVIGSSTPDELQQMLDDYPEVTEIVMVDVPGSMDDEANLDAARLLRQAGLATHVPADGYIASGGVDFFLAGADRSWEPGAIFGVHSWATGDGVEGKDVPFNDPAHQLYLDFYGEMGVSDDFYWFTLEAAPAESIHEMTDAELDRFDFGRELASAA